MKFSRNIVALLAVLAVMPAALGAQTTRISLATTTSTDNSGLLNVLIPPFEERTGIKVDIIAVGTGAAIKLGEQGDVDIILVHAPDAEQVFMDEGFGVNRRSVMHNDFVILGPTNDPADVASAKSAAHAFTRIARAASTSFISRGDDSGTHKKERALWKAAGIDPSGSWYKEVGQGMGAVIVLAGELEAYTLSDRGTWLSMRDKVDLKLLFEGDPALYNPYSVIVVNPAKYPHVKYDEAMELVAWLTSVEGQDIIRSFTSGGEVLFHPDAIP